MADFSGLNSTLNSPSTNVELLNSNLNVKQLKNRKNLNPVNVSSKIMKILIEAENQNQIDPQYNENQSQQIRIEPMSSTPPPPPPPKDQPQPHPQLEDLIRERNQQNQQKKMQKEELNNLITIVEQTDAEKNKVNMLFFFFI